MARLQSNDSGALEILFGRYAALCSPLHEASSATAARPRTLSRKPFFYLYKKSMLFDEAKGSAKNWITQIALHRALDRKSHLARRGFYAGTDIAVLGDILLGDTDLDREIGAKLNRVQLEEPSSSFPRCSARRLSCFISRDLDLREISKKLNQPLGNSRHHFYRGLERLRKSAFVQRLRGNKQW